MPATAASVLLIVYHSFAFLQLLSYQLFSLENLALCDIFNILQLRSVLKHFVVYLPNYYIIA